MQGLLWDRHWGLDQLPGNEAPSISLLIMQPKKPMSLPSVFQPITGAGLGLWLAFQICLLLSASLAPLPFISTPPCLDHHQHLVTACSPSLGVAPSDPPPPSAGETHREWKGWWWLVCCLPTGSPVSQRKVQTPQSGMRSLLWPELPHPGHFSVTSALTL